MADERGSPPRVVGRVKTTITHLEMLTPPGGTPLQPPLDGVEIVRSLEPTVSFYRFLYGTVGGSWLWSQRRLVPDEELLAAIRDPAVDLRVLWLHGTPAGYSELRSFDDGEMAIWYFGLMPEFIGKGLGRYFLDWTVRHAWRHGPRRLWVHTCDLDHPRALDGYITAGFEVFDKEEAHELVLNGMEIPQHVAGRAIEPP